jgi:hypothetical protein
MRKILAVLLAALTIASAARAQYVPIPNYVGINAGQQFRNDINNHLSGASAIAPRIVSLTLSNLPAEADGQEYWCSNCAQTTPCTVTATEVLCNAASGAITLNLPATNGTGRLLEAQKIDSSANACTLTPNGSDKINGAASIALSSQYQAASLKGTAAGSWNDARIAFSDIVGSLSNSQLPASAVTAGSYTNSNITVNSQGLVTAAANGTGGGGTPASPTGSVQFNNGGAFGGAAKASIDGNGDLADSNNITVGSLGTQGQGMFLALGFICRDNSAAPCEQRLQAFTSYEGNTFSSLTGKYLYKDPRDSAAANGGIGGGELRDPHLYYQESSGLSVVAYTNTWDNSTSVKNHFFSCAAGSAARRVPRCDSAAATDTPCSGLLQAARPARGHSRPPRCPAPPARASPAPAGRSAPATTTPTRSALLC